jgi:pimeloyl-ACP methyl ester carboxylesterase
VRKSAFVLAALSPFVLASLPIATATAQVATPAKSPHLEIRPDPVVATVDFRWQFAIQIHNDLDVGLYPDSLVGYAEDMDPGKTTGPRTQEIPLNHMRGVFRPISAGDMVAFNYTGNAYFENGRVRFTLYAHTSDGKAITMERSFMATPGPSSAMYPSETVKSNGKNVEIVYMRALRGGDTFPALLLIHGETSHARRQLVFAKQAAVEGYAVMIVSLPGYGQSEGERDLMGPASYAAVEKALDKLLHTSGVDSSRVVVWGLGEGAGLAARLAANHPEIRAAVLQGGLYDLWAVARARGGDAMGEFAKLAGRDSSAWALRSAIVSAKHIGVPVLMLHRGHDAMANYAQAEAYAAVLRASGSTVELSDVDGADRNRPLGLTAETGLRFIGKTLHFP